MFLQYFKIKRNNYKNQTLSIYQEIVNHSNHFIKYSLNDKDYDFDEIFETFSIVTVFYLKKLKDTNTQTNNEISQRIMDNFIKDLDQHFREKGIGDMSIGKYVKKYVKKFYYRLKTLDEVLKDNIDINFDNYIQKFGISNHGNIKKINEDLKNLYSEIVIDK
tara:strand:- start:63 stop:548 length:486 start_codon:yes stop_codon:yes gene_type:complete